MHSAVIVVEILSQVETMPSGAVKMTLLINTMQLFLTLRMETLSLIRSPQWLMAGFILSVRDARGR